jgi:hypothetical protein
MTAETLPAVDLAPAIGREHVAARTAASTALEHARGCGELLTEAKARLRHGGWRAWLAEHTSVSERTAQNYMRLSQNRHSSLRGGARV